MAEPKYSLVERYLALDNRNRADTLKAEMAAVRDAFKRHDYDTGSSQVQGAFPATPFLAGVSRLGWTEGGEPCVASGEVMSHGEGSREVSGVIFPCTTPAPPCIRPYLKRGRRRVSVHSVITALMSTCHHPRTDRHGLGWRDVPSPPGATAPDAVGTRGGGCQWQR